MVRRTGIGDTVRGASSRPGQHRTGRVLAPRPVASAATRGRVGYGIVAAFAFALTASAAVFNGVEYSDSGDIVPGVLTSQFKKAKSYADANNIPLVVMWVNPGCGYCGSFERSCLQKENVQTWMKSRRYVFVFAVGQDDSDGSSAWTYTRQADHYPMCRVHWKKNTAGEKVDYSFTGRSKKMHESQAKTKLTLAEQFMEVVDLYVGDYVPPGDVPSENGGQKNPGLPETLMPIPSEAPCGVYQSWPLLPAGFAVKKVKVSGLPSGLKYRDGRIEGVAKSAKTATVKVRLTASDGQSKTYAVPLTTTALPAWTKGRFYGSSTIDGVVCGLTVTVSSSGKISGKLTGPVKKKSFSEKYFAFFADGAYTVATTIGGKDVRLSFSQEGDLGRVSGVDKVAGIELAALQSVWERKDLKPPKFASGKSAPIVELANGIILKIGSKGKVKIGGTFGKVRMSGSAKLVAGFANGTLSPAVETVLSVSKKNLPVGYYGAVVDLLLDDKDNDGKIDFAEEKCEECSPQ